MSLTQANYTVALEELDNIKGSLKDRWWILKII